MKKAAPDRLLVWSTEPSVNIKIVPSALRASMVSSSCATMAGVKSAFVVGMVLV